MIDLIIQIKKKDFYSWKYTNENEQKLIINLLYNIASHAHGSHPVGFQRGLQTIDPTQVAHDWPTDPGAIMISVTHTYINIAPFLL